MSKTFLRLHGVGEIPADQASLVLTRMNTAYKGLWVLDSMREHLLQMRSDEDLGEILLRYKQIESWCSNMVFDANQDIWTPEVQELHKIHELHRYELLELKSVVLQSPGFWEFLGKLTPLEVIRQYLNDRHERKKDNGYRNDIEREKLLVQNGILKIKYIKDLVQLYRASGMSDEDIQKFLRDNVLLPLLRLESLQDANVISYAEIARKVKAEESEEVDA